MLFRPRAGAKVTEDNFVDDEVTADGDDITLGSVASDKEEVTLPDVELLVTTLVIFVPTHRAFIVCLSKALGATVHVYMCPQGISSAFATLSMHTMHDKSLSSPALTPSLIPRTVAVSDKGKKQTGHETPSVVDVFLDVVFFFRVDAFLLELFFLPFF